MAYTHAQGEAFWSEFDGRTLYGGAAFWSIAGAAEAPQVQSVWRAVREEGVYPDDFAQWAQDRAAPWQQLAALQREIIEAHFGNDFDTITLAFADFGQGVLISTDPERAAGNDSIHMMDGQTPAEVIGYHRWHASIRAIQLSGGDVPWWEEMARRLGFAWAVQSLARPVQRRFPGPPNQAIDPALVAAAAEAWLTLSPEVLDRQFQLTPDVVGYHPDPLHPA
jgi:hypothetical protein